MRNAAKILSTFFGLGFFPVAPGTLASLAAALLYKFWLGSLDWRLYSAIIAALFLLGVQSATTFARELNEKDPGTIVIDEVCGQSAALILVPAAWISVLACFVLFRVFDVLKPFPIRRIENLPWGWGIMTDDLAAAAYSAALVHIFLFIRGAWLA